MRSGLRQAAVTESQHTDIGSKQTDQHTNRKDQPNVDAASSEACTECGAQKLPGALCATCAQTGAVGGVAAEPVLEVATNPLLAADTSTTAQLAGGDIQSGQSDEQQRLVFDIEEWNRHVAHDPSVVIGLPESARDVKVAGWRARMMLQSAGVLEAELNQRFMTARAEAQAKQDWIPGAPDNFSSNG